MIDERRDSKECAQVRAVSVLGGLGRFLVFLAVVVSAELESKLAVGCSVDDLQVRLLEKLMEISVGMGWRITMAG
jgi:hypothetical protein